ncbi:unnamed protein product [Cuscuta epithymum]|uniref:Secreted protein n=1 Tax=Cuscuta epithymum TaxID=186058 RepID=A0AAV0CW88_9ASTE|nr:unnamed protein product [Cuscuta epithymum]
MQIHLFLLVMSADTERLLEVGTPVGPRTKDERSTGNLDADTPVPPCDVCGCRTSPQVGTPVGPRTKDERRLPPLKKKKKKKKKKKEKRWGEEERSSYTEGNLARVCQIFPHRRRRTPLDVEISRDVEGARRTKGACQDKPAYPTNDHGSMDVG